MSYRRASTLAILAALAMLAGIFLAALAAHDAIAATPHPYGYAPNALTWRAPPDGVRTVRPSDGSITLPRGVSDVDVWTVRHGRAVYRLRQGIDPVGLRFGVRQYGFETRRHHVLAGYVPVNRDLFTFTDRITLRVYWWRG